MQHKPIRYELSPLQEGMLIHSLAEKGVGMYISQGVHRFSHIDISALEEAWQKVVDRHEVLRTSFVWDGLKKPLQVVHPQVEVRFKDHDLLGLTEWEQKLALRALLAEDRRKGFDLTTPPLFRLHILRCSEESVYLVFSHHHLLLDGWSNPILLEEVRMLYHAIINNLQPALPPAKPFRLYIEWLKNQTLEKEKLFWQAYLRGQKRSTPLPYDLGGRRQADHPLTSEEWPLEIKEPLFSRLQSTARQCRVTLNTLIQGAWAILLSRYSQDEQVVFGSLVSGRSAVLDGIEGMVGMFLNTLPLLVKVLPDAPLNEWLRSVHAQQNQLNEHEFCPLNRIQSWSEVPRGTPLFESVIDTNNTHRPQQEVEDAVMAPINQSMPLLLFAKPSVDRLVLIIIYNNRRFTKSCIAQVGEQLTTLLENMSGDMTRPLRDISMISAAEAQRTLITWNQTKVPYPGEMALHQFFENQAASTPEATAVFYRGRASSYSALNGRANQLARHLRQLGLGRGSLVGFCLERSLEMVIVLLAILKSGAAYIPLDPSYPLDRLKMMLTTAEAGLLITQNDWLPRLGGLAHRDLCIDADAPWDSLDAANLDLTLSPEDVAYVLFTSGSTGTPKGIVIPHRVPVNRMFIEHDPFEADEALCAKTSICFVDSAWELWSAWSNGLAVTLIPEEEIKDPTSLIETLATSGSTRIVLVPSLLRAMLDAAQDLGARLPRLKHWICSGEALPGDLSARFVQELPEAVLTNLYGATEIWDATRCDTREDLPYEPMPIGRTMGNMQGYVLDERMRPVPVGVIGELYFGGAHVAHGYWRRPDITARQFLPDPFAKEPGRRLYRTGDLGRWLPDGNFEYLCRRDQQVQLRGFRIELEDIESAIRRHPEINQAAVLVSDDQRLVAYVVAPRLLPSASELRAFIRKQLPEHMTPAFYLPLDHIPLTPNGKTDRRKLPRPGAEEMKRLIAKEAGSREPSTPTEETVAGVWANHLGLDAVGAESDFFQLGGESLMAVRIVGQLSKLFQISIPLSVLLKTRTVAEMAEWIDKASSQKSPEENAASTIVVRTDQSKKAPLSYAQQQMWLLDQLNPGSLSYTISHIIRFPNDPDSNILAETLTRIQQRHEALHTTFTSIDGEPYQVINEAQPFSLSVTDLTGLPEKTRQATTQRKIREQLKTSWNLETGPLFRCQLLRLDSQEALLVLTLHHICADGHSMGILAHEIQETYSALAQNRPDPCRPLAIQYSDYAVWQRDWLKGDHVEEQIQYWRRQLDDASVLELPTDHPRPDIHQYRGGEVVIALDRESLHRMRTLAVREGATTFMALLTVVQLLLARYSGQDDICVGTPTANRSRAELEPLIGYFVNTLVIRGRIVGNPSFRDQLQATRNTCVEAYDHQDVPFEVLVDRLGVHRSLSRNPLFQILFVHQKTIGVHNSGQFTHQSGLAQETANFDLVLNVRESLEHLECHLIYNADLFEAETVRLMGQRLELLFLTCASVPDRPISQIDILLPTERQKILTSFSQAEHLPLEHRTAHAIISSHAVSTPTQIAVRHGAEHMTYAELECRANRMARYLVSRGVGPEVVIGWCVERTPVMLVGLLAIMKAGGAFLPLDPALPEERMAHVVQDASVRLVISQRNLADRLPGSCPSFFLDDLPNPMDIFSDTPMPETIGLNNLAYIIYTSGSTGTPKGVMVEHGNLARLISAQISRFNLNPTHRVLQTLALGFDAALGEIFRTLMAGATLHLADREDLLPGPALIELLKKEHITAVTLSAASLAALPRVGPELTDLENLTVGGDTITPELATHWGRNRRIMNGYGPTETTIGATLAVNWPLRTKPPLGKPLPNVRLYVLDRFMLPVPQGTPGELYIGGIGVSRGYLNRPDQTAAVFVPDPFADTPGSRLYRTGDLVRWLADGQLEFLGRKDHQVKIRGYRVEPGEIVAALQRHPSVGQAVVMARQTKDGKRLAAYVTPRETNNNRAGSLGSEIEDTHPEPGELRAHLKACLPDYMVPTFITICERFPLTLSGKIDRNALPEPDSSADFGLDRTPPRNVLEERIAGIWAEVLGLDRVGIHANFFELGGDSIMSIRVVARITEAGYQMSLKQMFTSQTVAELAAALEDGESAIKADQGLVSGEIPLTPVQRWFFEHAPDNPAYFNQWMVVPIPPPGLDCDRMREAVRAIMLHHDALRMRYVRTDPLPEDHSGQSKPKRWVWSQYLSEECDSVPFNTVDLSVVPDHECTEVIQREFDRLQNSLDLEMGPLWRVCWFYPGPHLSGRLLVVVHHLVVDIVSWAPLMDDLLTVYRQAVNGSAIRLPLKTSSFKQWAEALVAYAHSSELAAELPYWLKQREFEAQPLPLDYPHGDHGLETTKSVLMALPPSQTRRLLDLALPYFETRPAQLVTAALAVAIGRHTGNSRLQIILEGQGREDIAPELNLSRTVGWFTSFYPVSFTLDLQESLSVLVRCALGQINAVPNRGVGYSIFRYGFADETIKAQLQSWPATEVTFNFSGQSGGTAVRGGQVGAMGNDAGYWDLLRETGKIQLAEAHQGERRHLLEISAGIIDDSLVVRFAYGGKFKERTIQNLGQALRKTLVEIYEFCDAEYSTSPRKGVELDDQLRDEESL